jgi:hypothetical protein
LTNVPPSLPRVTLVVFPALFVNRFVLAQLSPR